MFDVTSIHEQFHCELVMTNKSFVFCQEKFITHIIAHIFEIRFVSCSLYVQIKLILSSLRNQLLLGCHSVKNWIPLAFVHCKTVVEYACCLHEFVTWADYLHLS